MTTPTDNEPVAPEAPKPREGESYDDYQERCQDAGHSESQCERWWEQEAKVGAVSPCRYRKVVQAFYASPWAILPAKLLEIRAFLELKAAGGNISEEQVREIVAARPRADYPVAGKVAVLPLFGTLSQRMNLMSDASGGTSTEEFGALFDAAVADKGVRCVCLVADSPGGSVFGVPQLADKVFAARDKKRIVGIADSMCASAAYWVLSQCSELYCCPGGTMGSIGVLAAHTDMSAAEEKMGVKTTLVSAGKFKTRANPFTALSTEDRDRLQADVDQYYGMFVGAVARGRATTEYKVKNGYGQGDMLIDEDCVAAGLCDKVMTFEKVLKKYGGDEPGARAEVQPEFTADRQRQWQLMDMEG